MAPFPPHFISMFRCLTDGWNWHCCFGGPQCGGVPAWDPLLSLRITRWTSLQVRSGAASAAFNPPHLLVPQSITTRADVPSQSPFLFSRRYLEVPEAASISLFFPPARCYACPDGRSPYRYSPGCSSLSFGEVVCGFDSVVDCPCSNSNPSLYHRSAQAPPSKLLPLWSEATGFHLLLEPRDVAAFLVDQNDNVLPQFTLTTFNGWQISINLPSS